jgi:hypothetical protein
MQIHELTKLQRTNEGLLDGVKSAIKAVNTSSEHGGLVKAYQTARDDAYAKDSQKKLDSIAKGMNKGKKPGDKGYWIAPGQAGYDDQQLAKRNPNAAQKVDQYTDEFEKTFGEINTAGTAGPMPARGKKLEVGIQRTGETTPTLYYKSDTGVWTREDGLKIDSEKAISMLDKEAELEKAREIPATGVAPVRPAGVVKEATPAYSPGAHARRQALKVAPVQSNATQTPAADEHLPLSKFSQWADAKIPELKGADQDPALKPEVLAIEKSKDVKQAAPFFKKLLTKAFSTGAGGSSYGYSGAGGAPAGNQEKLAANFFDLVQDYGDKGLFKALQNDPPKGTTGSDTLDAALRKARVLAEELKAFKASK